MSINIDRHTGYLYVVSFSNGMIKFGVSNKRPEERIESHRNLMAVVGAEIKLRFISEKTSFPLRVEKEVKDRFSNFVEHGNEWIKGVAFGVVVNFIKENLIPVVCDERKGLIEKEDLVLKETIAYFSDLIKKNSEMDRAKMAICYAEAIEYDATQRGYSGKLMQPSDTVKDTTKLKECLARYAYAHTSSDVAYLLELISTRKFNAFEAHLIECIEILNVHEGVMMAIDKFEEEQEI